MPANTRFPLDLLELELLADVLGSKLRSFVGASSTFNYGATPPAPSQGSFNLQLFYYK